MNRTGYNGNYRECFHKSEKENIKLYRTIKEQKKEILKNEEYINRLLFERDEMEKENGKLKKWSFVDLSLAAVFALAIAGYAIYKGVS